MHENELFGDNKCTNNEFKTKGGIISSYNYPPNTKSTNQSTTSLISRLCSAEPFIGKNSPNSERFSIRKKLSETLFSLKRPPTHTLSSSLIELAPSSSILQNATNSILDKFSAKKLLQNKCSSNESLNKWVSSDIFKYLNSLFLCLVLSLFFLLNLIFKSFICLIYLLFFFVFF